MFRKIVFWCLLIFIPAFSFAQDDIPPRENTLPPYSLKDHLVYGGNLGLSFGSVTNISVSPLVGYKVTDKFIPGIGLTYNYLKFNYPGYSEKGINIYGGSIWSRYYILDNVFLHGEYESLNGEWDPYFRPGYRYYLNSLLVGGGYREDFGGLSSYILVLYNVTYNEDSPYPSPLIIRAGFGFGL
jgi:hypothetical protein